MCLTSGSEIAYVISTFNDQMHTLTDIMKFGSATGSKPAKSLTNSFAVSMNLAENIDASV